MKININNDDCPFNAVCGALVGCEIDPTIEECLQMFGSEPPDTCPLRREPVEVVYEPEETK